MNADALLVSLCNVICCTYFILLFKADDVSSFV